MDPALALSDTCERAIASGVTPGGTIALADADNARWVFAFGATADASDGGQPVTAQTIYDLASLTKPMAAAALTMRAIADGAIALDLPAHQLLPELDRPSTRAITVRHLVGHAAGFPAHVRFYEQLFASPPAAPRDALVDLALAVDPEIEPGTRVVYSDVGYIILGALLERACGAPLDDLFRRHVGGPLGLDSVAYAVRPEEPIAPTERAPDRGGELLLGVVHDENARAGGGVFAHAGLFGAAGDVLAFAIEMARAARGEQTAAIDPALARTFVTTAAAPGSSWRLGWDTPSPLPVVSHAGDAWSRDGFGHLGYTGTSMWIDPARGRAVVILTNRVYRSRDPGPIRDFRRAIMDAVVGALV